MDASIYPTDGDKDGDGHDGVIGCGGREGWGVSSTLLHRKDSHVTVTMYD